MRLLQLAGADPQTVGLEAGSVELFGIVKQCRHAPAAHVVANALDHARGRQSLAEDFLCQLATARGDNVAPSAKPSPQAGELLRGVRVSTRDPPQIQRGHGKSSRSISPQT